MFGGAVIPRRIDRGDAEFRRAVQNASASVGWADELAIPYGIPS
jgi:hypothetical protein